MTDKQQTIEQAYTELQSIVAEFENEEVNLEKSIPKFKRGLQLAAALKEKLSVLKNEVEEIKAKFEEEDLPESDNMSL